MNENTTLSLGMGMRSGIKQEYDEDSYAIRLTPLGMNADINSQQTSTISLHVPSRRVQSSSSVPTLQQIEQAKSLHSSVSTANVQSTNPTIPTPDTNFEVRRVGNSGLIVAVELKNKQSIQYHRSDTTNTLPIIPTAFSTTVHGEQNDTNINSSTSLRRLGGGFYGVVSPFAASKVQQSSNDIIPGTPMQVSNRLALGLNASELEHQHQQQLKKAQEAGKQNKHIGCILYMY
jgi:hypothetical protein